MPHRDLLTRACLERRLTPRSRRGPTASRPARLQVVRIILPAGRPPRRRPRLTSNVRPRRNARVLVAALRTQPVSLARFGGAAKTVGKAQALVSCGTRGICSLHAAAVDLAASGPVRDARRSFERKGQLLWSGPAHVVGVSALRSRSLASLARRFTPRWAAVGCSTSRLRRLVLRHSSRSGKVNSQAAWRHLRQPRSGLHQRHQLLRIRQCLFQRPDPRPNPSVEARPNGKAGQPAPGCAYHPSAGWPTSPSAPPHLER